MASKAEYRGDISHITAVSAGVPARLIERAEAEKSQFVAAWDDLAANASEPNPFYESWYLLPSLREFGADAQIFTAFDGARLIGLMPLSHLSRYGRWPVPHAQNWLHPNIFLGTPLVRAGYETMFWEAIFAEMDQRPGNALFLHINGMASGGKLSAALDATAANQSRHFAKVSEEERAFLQSDLSPAAYYEDAMRSKKRKELRRQKRRLGEMGNLAISRSDGNVGLGSWINEFLTLEQRGWKGQQGSALACAQETQRLFHDALSGAADRGRLELLDMRLDGKPLAMLANFICPPGSFSFKTAFDEEFSRFSPGVLLQIENLALLERSGVEWCDSCAAEGHPMIDSIWTGRRQVGRYSIAIGGAGRRALFGAYLGAEMARARGREKHRAIDQDMGERK
ncbi:MAG: GNAT family N-acetyltransferase [Sphingorhabdus sp.]